jgi:putative DNA primase/helicase
MAIVRYRKPTDKTDGKHCGQWLDGKAVYVFQTKQWMIWNEAYWRADERWLMIKFAFNLIRETKQALFDTGNHSARKIYRPLKASVNSKTFAN